MRKHLKRAAALLLLIGLIVTGLYFHARLFATGPTYEGLTVAEWEAEADCLANTNRTDIYFRFGEGLRQFTGQSTRLACFLRLSSGSDAEAIPVLIALLESPQYYARLTALSGLRSRGLLAKDALPAMRKALDDSDEDVRLMAQQVISNLELLEKLGGKAR